MTAAAGLGEVKAECLWGSHQTLQTHTSWLELRRVSVCLTSTEPGHKRQVVFQRTQNGPRGDNHTFKFHTL